MSISSITFEVKVNTLAKTMIKKKAKAYWILNKFGSRH